MDAVRVNAKLAIPHAELELRASRSGGPGGQHVNVTSSRVELLWDVGASRVLCPRQRARIRKHLGNRIDTRGVLHLACQTHRSQHQNRAEVMRRLARLVRAALAPRKPRVATRPTKASKKRRLDTKRKRGDRKKLRRAPRGDD
jgi:ribosome-associated protein